jgi:tRNA1Val (adenine37-N6)-methyltransferase
LDLILEYTLDRFLGGRIVAAQPKNGFRAGHDSVFLAAAIPDEPGANVLELGSGAGIASLCFAWRASHSSVQGLEIDPELVEIANANADRNGMGGRVRFSKTDVRAFRGELFDHVFFNPPFHPGESTQSPNAARDVAKRDSGDSIRLWTDVALAEVRPGGTVTAILSFERLPDMLASLKGHAVWVFPLYPRFGVEPKRAIVQITVDSGEIAFCGGLVLHRDDGSNSVEAEAVLRFASPLALR